MVLFSEDILIEQPAITLLGQIGWDTANCFDETFSAAGSLGRETSNEVVLVSRLRLALRKLNSGLPEPPLQLAVEELTRDRGILQLRREVLTVTDGLRPILQSGFEACSR